MGQHTPGRRPVGAPTAISMRSILACILGATLVLSCSRFGNPGKGTVTDEISAIWTDLGVDPDDTSLLGYGIDRQSDSDAETSEWCTDRDQSDRWVARRSGILGDGVLTPDEVVEGLVERYADARPRLFRSTTGGGGQLFYAVDLDRGIWVSVDITRFGRVSVLVRHSICPVDGFSTEPNGPYEEVPVPGA